MTYGMTGQADIHPAEAIGHGISGLSFRRATPIGDDRGGFAARGKA